MEKIVSKRSNGTLRVQHKTVGESMTEQQHRDAVNINNIIAKARRTGMVPITIKSPLFGDFSAVGTYQESVDMIRQAQEAFMQIPSEIREMFKNDPSKFMEWMSDPENLEKAKEYGLIKQEEIEKIQKVEIVNQEQEKQGDKVSA